MKATEYAVQTPTCVGGKSGSGFLFDKLIRIVLRKASLIIQDDSGIPYALLQDRFESDIWGAYEGPAYLVDSCTYYQPALARAWHEMASRGQGQPLPLKGFGYDVVRDCLLGSDLAGKIKVHVEGHPELVQLASLQNLPDEEGQEFCMYRSLPSASGADRVQLSTRCVSSASQLIPWSQLERCIFAKDTATVAIVSLRK